MDTETSSVWDETGAIVRPADEGRPLTQRHGSSLAASSQALNDLEPASDVEFITILTPCLQLVAPVGMSEDAQDTWFEAARMALARFPASLLRRGAEDAMMHADHPSKIVPLIVKEAGPAMDQRLRIARGRDDQPRQAALPTPGGEYCTPDELDSICRQFKVGRYSQHRPPRNPARPVEVITDADPNRPCRAPSREDYIRLFGIDPEAHAAPAAEAA